MLRRELVCASLLLCPVHAAAVAIPPCTPAGVFADMDIIPLTNGIATYCVSDFGWSDAWFIGASPPVYDPLRDVLSGDDAPNLHFGIKGGAGPGPTSGFGWISPIMDGGDLEPTHLTTSPPWDVLTPVHFTVGTVTAESLVHNPLGIDLLITTALDPVGQQITQRFTFTNTTTGTTFDRMRFADYFNFHPNGSVPGNASLGSVSYDPLSGITITGPNDGTLIASGSMRGERVDDAHGISLPSQTIPLPVLDMVQTDTYPDPLLTPIGVPSGPGDVAGALAWDLGELAPGASVAFSIFKLADPLTLETSEPPGAWMLCTALLLLAYSLGFSTPRPASVRVRAAV